MSEKTTTKLDDQAVDFLKDECNRLQTLYSQAHDNAQNIFNFYLTFVGTVVGALVVLLQVTSLNALQTKVSVAGLLFFLSVVGTVYLSAISGRYAHLARYARAIDELRRHLIAYLNVPMPEIYSAFLKSDEQSKRSAARKSTTWLIWFFPTGTYTMFIAIISSLSLAVFTWVIASFGDVTFESLTSSGIIVFLITLTIYNAYSRFFIERVSQRLHVRIDTGHELSIWAGKTK